MAAGPQTHSQKPQCIMLTDENRKQGTKATAIEMNDVRFNYVGMLEFAGNIPCAVREFQFE